MHFINSTPKFFRLSIVPSCYWELTIVIFSIFFRPKSSKSINFFLFLLFFNVLNWLKKGKKLTILFDFIWTKKIRKGYDCKTLNNMRVLLIIEKLKGTIDKVQNLRVPLIISRISISMKTEIKLEKDMVFVLLLCEYKILSHNFYGCRCWII